MCRARSGESERHLRRHASRKASTRSSTAEEPTLIFGFTQQQCLLAFLGLMLFLQVCHQLSHESTQVQTGGLIKTFQGLEELCGIKVAKQLECQLKGWLPDACPHCKASLRHPSLPPSNACPLLRA